MVKTKSARNIRRERDSEQARLNKRLAKLNDGVQRGTIDHRDARLALAEMTPGGAAGLRKIEDRVAEMSSAPPPNDEDTFIVGGQKIDLANMTKGDRLPRFIRSGDGKIYDLEIGCEVTLNDTIEIDGRVLKVGDFAGSGLTSLYELYESYLYFAETHDEMVFRISDGSNRIPDFVTDDHAKKFLRSRFAADGTLEQYIPVDHPNLTFEVYLVWTIATTRWRIKWELENRLLNEMDIKNRSIMNSSRDMLELTLIVCEKFLALPERQKQEAL